jgi:hypothetical protein
MWSRVERSGDVYKGVYSGWYNVREECFVSDSDAKDMKYVDVITGNPLLQMNEEVREEKEEREREREREREKEREREVGNLNIFQFSVVFFPIESIS